MSALFEQLQASAAAVRARLPGVAPEVALVLGSGLAGAVQLLEDAESLPLADVPHVATPSVSGHPGRLAFGRVGLGPGGRAPGAAAHLRGLDGRGDRLSRPAAGHARGPGGGAHQRLGRGP